MPANVLDNYGFKPRKVYRIHHTKFRSIAKEFMESRIGMDVEIFFDYDEETCALQFSVEGRWEAGLDDDALEVYDENTPTWFHPDEWYQNVEGLLHELTGTTNFIAYAEPNEEDLHDYDVVIELI